MRIYLFLLILSVQAQAMNNDYLPPFFPGDEEVQRPDYQTDVLDDEQAPTTGLISLQQLFPDVEYDNILSALLTPPLPVSAPPVTYRPEENPADEIEGVSSSEQSAIAPQQPATRRIYSTREEFIREANRLSAKRSRDAQVALLATLEPQVGNPTIEESVIHKAMQFDTERKLPAIFHIKKQFIQALLACAGVDSVVRRLSEELLLNITDPTPWRRIKKTFITIFGKVDHIPASIKPIYQHYSLLLKKESAKMCARKSRDQRKEKIHLLQQAALQAGILPFAYE